MKSALQTIVMTLLCLLIGVGITYAQAGEGCVTAKCHNDIGTQEFIHGPVGAGICTVCHNKVDGKDHEFKYAAEKEELCFACHEQTRTMMLEEHQHTPVAEGDCVGCHDPHQSNFRFSLKADGADLCYVCHKKDEFNRAYVHGPVGVGDCNVCHNPHASDNLHQLTSPPEQLCYTCHQEQSGIPSMRHIHPPVADNCVNCHNPHSQDYKYLLADDTPKLCYSCHEDIAGYIDSEYQHSPVASGDCDKCHNVHASENPRMFPRPQMELCLSCHEELDEYVSEQTHKHGPIKDGDCNACHDPHGSGNHKILRKYFPSEFYMPYETENYASCFECHNKDIALDQATTTLTDFRDGDVNLHYLHVNKEVKGRSCKACHEVHASSQEKHIRESVPFGNMNWDLPVTFTKFEDGGKCVVGCHAPKEYHRK